MDRNETNIKSGDTVKSNGKIANVHRALGDKTYEVRKVGTMASIPFPMVWLKGKEMPVCAASLKVVKRR